jgi:ABC-type glycerol-3-phosphate transport system substrate-binding protein
MGGGVAKKESGWESDINTKFILASPETVAASELYFGLKPYNYGDFLSVGSAEKRELFLNNKIAMSIMWSDYVPELLKSPEASDFGFAVVPGKVSMLGGATFFVNRKSPYKREAVEYMLSLMNTATQVELMKQGMASPFRSPYNDPGVQGIPYVASFRDSLERGVYMIDAGVDSQIIQDAITEVIQDIWIHGGDVKSKLAEAQAKIELERMKLF